MLDRYSWFSLRLDECRSERRTGLFYKLDFFRGRNPPEHRVAVWKPPEPVDYFLVSASIVEVQFVFQGTEKLNRAHLIGGIFAVLERQIQEFPFVYRQFPVESAHQGLLGERARRHPRQMRGRCLGTCCVEIDRGRSRPPGNRARYSARFRGPVPARLHAVPGSVRGCGCQPLPRPRTNRLERARRTRT